MKKSAILLFSLCGFIVFAWFTARLTHIIDFYSTPTSANQPTLTPGTIITASRLKTPHRLDFICFKDKNNIKYLFRCIGLPGDEIELKNADVYVNGTLLKEPYCWNEYTITKKQMGSIKGYIERYKYPMTNLNDSLSTITLSEMDLFNYHLKLNKFVTPKEKADTNIFADFSKRNFNADNLGPVKVPPGSYFLLGDNRHDAMDSRYVGFIKNEQVVSTALNTN